jgi:hypothetical protein
MTAALEFEERSRVEFEECARISQSGAPPPNVLLILAMAVGAWALVILVAAALWHLSKTEITFGDKAPAAAAAGAGAPVVSLPGRPQLLPPATRVNDARYFSEGAMPGSGSDRAARQFDWLERVELEPGRLDIMPQHVKSIDGNCPVSARSDGQPCSSSAPR